MTDERFGFIAFFAAFALALGGLALAGCGGGDASTPEAHAPEEAAAGENGADGHVELEPAYPEEVSSEGLTAEDIRQQEVAHSHDGEAHAHEEGEDEHEHGEDDHGH